VIPNFFLQLEIFVKLKKLRKKNFSTKVPNLFVLKTAKLIGKNILKHNKQQVVDPNCLDCHGTTTLPCGCQRPIGTLAGSFSKGPIITTLIVMGPAPHAPY
jgi:hypothetical protein